MGWGGGWLGGAGRVGRVRVGAGREGGGRVREGAGGSGGWVGKHVDNHMLQGVVFCEDGIARGE